MRATTPLFLALFAAIPRAHAAGAADPLGDCYRVSKIRIEAAKCLDDEVRSSNDMLAQTTRRMERMMKELDSVTGRAEAAPAFAGSEQAFLDFREKNCNWRAAQMSAGTGAGDVLRDCLIEMNRARVEELQAQLARPNRPTRERTQ